MKVLESTVDKITNKVWLNVELDRSSDILSKELFTANDVENAKKQAVVEFLKYLYDSWTNSLNN